MQTDIKRLIAYSSISHMGYVLLGIFALGEVSLTGAALQMFSHGIVTGLLFAMAGLVIHNIEVRDLRKLGGLAKQVPIICRRFRYRRAGVPGSAYHQRLCRRVPHLSGQL